MYRRLLSAWLLLAYKLNSQSVLFAGYSDDRELTDRGRLVKSGRHVRQDFIGAAAIRTGRVGGSGRYLNPDTCPVTHLGTLTLGGSGTCPHISGMSTVASSRSLAMSLNSQ
jgi:hypothetical protein